MHLSMRDWFKSKRGFSLPEIIVVIAIIGILSAIGYAYYSTAKAQARDRVRMAAVEQVGLAIEQYKDKYGVYPDRGCYEATKSANYWAGSETYGALSWLSPTSVQCTEYIVGLVPEFLPELPREPGPVKAGKGYIYLKVGNAYKFMTHHSVESLRITSKDQPFSRMGSCSTAVTTDAGIYAVYSPGAECW